MQQEIDTRVMAGQREAHDRMMQELQSLRRDITTHFQGLEDKVGAPTVHVCIVGTFMCIDGSMLALQCQVNAVAAKPVPTGGGPSLETLEDYSLALKAMGEAARSARTQVMTDVEQRIQRLADLSALTQQKF